MLFGFTHVASILNDALLVFGYLENIDGKFAVARHQCRLSLHLGTAKPHHVSVRWRLHEGIKS